MRHVAVVLPGKKGGQVVKGPDAYLRDIIAEEVTALAPLAKIVKLTAPPVIGAVLRAMDETGTAVSPSVLESLKNVTL